VTVAQASTRGRPPPSVLVRRRIRHYLELVRGPFLISLGLLLVVSLLTAAKAWIVKPVVDTFTSGETTMAHVWRICGVVVGIFVAQAVVTWAYTWFARAASAGLVRAIRSDLFAHLLRQSLGWFVTRPSSDLTSRVINDVTTFETAAVNTIQEVIRDALTILGLLGVLFIHDWRLAGICLGALAVVGLVLRWTNTTLGGLARRVQEVLSRVARQLTETIGGMELVLSVGLGRRWEERFRNVIRDHFQSSVRVQRASATTVLAVSLVIAAGIGIILVVTGSAVIRGEITVSEFASFLATLYLLQAPAVSLGASISYIARGFAAGERAFELLDAQGEMPEPAEAVDLERPEGCLEFRGVSFGYGENAVLRDLSFAVEPGRIGVLVGDSGAGKSTVARLLLRFYDPWKGEVLIDGVPLTKLRQASLRRCLSYVGQDVYLFDDTIEFNLRLARPDASAEELDAAIREACLDDFIAGLPEGLATPVGERGVFLSGGQRQRIALARSILSGAPVLLLDEATSALDMDLERRLLSNLAHSSRRHTIFAITHRLSLAEVADRVFVLKDGVLAESGTAATLRDRDGEYARLARASRAQLTVERSVASDADAI